MKNNFKKTLFAGLKDNSFSNFMRTPEMTAEEYLNKHYPGLSKKFKEQDEDKNKEDKIDLNKFF